MPSAASTVLVGPGRCLPDECLGDDEEGRHRKQPGEEP